MKGPGAYLEVHIVCMLKLADLNRSLKEKYFDIVQKGMGMNTEIDPIASIQFEESHLHVYHLMVGNVCLKIVPLAFYLVIEEKELCLILTSLLLGKN